MSSQKPSSAGLLQVTKRSIRKWICFECGKYLSVGPLKMNIHGDPICGRCRNVECPINEPLTAIMKRVVFPCSNDRYGCQRQLLWNEVRDHESECKHAQDELEVAEETFPIDLYDEMKCAKCKDVTNLLTMYGIEKQHLICSICEMAIKEAEHFFKVTNQTFLRNVTEILPYPCKYRNDGCNTLVTWRTASKHTLYCATRKIKCPISPLTECRWYGSSARVREHVQLKHSDYFLEDLAMRIDLTDASAANVTKFLTFANSMFMFLIHVNASDNKIYTSVKLVSTNNVLEYDYRFVFYDECRIVKYRTHKRYVGDNTFLSINKELSDELNIDYLIRTLNNSSKVWCCVEINPVGRMSDIDSYSFRRCSYPGCTRIALRDKVGEHEALCTYKPVSCRWSNCPDKVPMHDAREHQANCPYRSLYYVPFTNYNILNFYKLF